MLLSAGCNATWSCGRRDAADVDIVVMWSCGACPANLHPWSPPRARQQTDLSPQFCFGRAGGLNCNGVHVHHDNAACQCTDPAKSVSTCQSGQVASASWCPVGPASVLWWSVFGRGLMEMKRIVFFLPPQTVKAAEALSARYASNRSEVLRLAVGEGLKHVRPVLAKLQGVRIAELAGASGSGRGGGKRLDRGVASPSAGVVPLDAEAAVPRLVEYARSARRVRPGLDPSELRVMIATQAQIVGVLPDDVEDAVDGAIGELFGGTDVLPVADPTVPPE